MPRACAAVSCRPAQAASPSPDCTADNLLAGKAPWQQRDVTGNPALVTDGNTVPEGAVRDGPAAIKLEGTAGSLSYDLGKPTPVSAFFLQADANDTYRVSGSSDGKLQPAGAGGQPGRPRHGMRTRAMQIEPHVRYLRIGEGDGDGVLFDLRVRGLLPGADPVSPGAEDGRGADGGRTEAGGRAAAAQAAAPSRSPFGPFELTLGPDYRRARALCRQPQPRGRARRGPAATAAAAGPDTGTERFFPVMLLLFVGSGCAALMYEIVWFQLLQLVLGSSAVSIAVLLGMFMAGMCIGSLGLPRYVLAAGIRCASTRCWRS